MKTWKFFSVIALITLVMLSACSLSPAEPGPETDPGAGAAAGTSDPCLQGTWVMPAGDLDMFLEVMMPQDAMRVTAGELLMIFDGDSFAYLSYGFILHIDMDTNQWMEATASFENTGTFSTEGDIIDFNTVSSESESTEWTAFKDGETVTVPGPGPDFGLTPPGSSPYRCSAEYLEIDVPHATLGTATMLFTRRP